MLKDHCESCAIPKEWGGHHYNCLYDAAADEIERLRIDRDRWRKIATNLINGAEQQIDAFREPWDKSTNEAWLGAWHDYHQAVTDEQG